jgi:hypothetical protein
MMLHTDGPGCSLDLILLLNMRVHLRLRQALRNTMDCLFVA